MKATLLSLMALLALAFNTSAASPEDASPVTVTALDLVTKVYGVLDPSYTQKQTKKAAKKALRINPSSEKNPFASVDATASPGCNTLWVESDDGYLISYSGMMPKVSAVAEYDAEGLLTGYCYFFQFPYTPSTRAKADREQCVFCGSLLQELNDFAMMVGVPDLSEGLFQAIGSYGSNHISMMLTDEPLNDAGTYILMLDITPNAFNHADSVLAENR